MARTGQGVRDRRRFETDGRHVDEVHLVAHVTLLGHRKPVGEGPVGLDREVLDAVGHMGLVGAEGDGDAVGRVANDVEHQLDSLIRREAAPHVGRQPGGPRGGLQSTASVTRSATFSGSARSLDSYRSIASNIDSSAPAPIASTLRSERHRRQLLARAPRRRTTSVVTASR